MDTAWIQVFVLTLTECVAPAGKTVCQERELELQFLTESDCKAALEQLVQAADCLAHRSPTDRPATPDTRRCVLRGGL